MKKLFSLFTIAIVSVTVAQQKLIAIKGTTTDAIATTLDEAINIAQPNDKIYLPGGNFEFTGSLEKPIHIIGIGFQNGLHVDGNTVINGNIIINSAGSNSIFEGFHLTGYFQCGVEANCNNLLIKRCNFSGIYGSGNFAFSWTNCQIVNSVVRETLRFGFYGYPSVDIYPNNCSIKNCFIKRISNLTNSIVSNCIFVSASSVIGCSNSTFKNNIFASYDYFNNAYGNAISYGSNGINFINNAVAAGLGDGVISDLNNIVINNTNEVFVNATDFFFNPNFDFQLLSTFAGNNAGDDGTDVGIYGGQYPWKNGSLPISPNIEQNNSFLDVQNEQFKLRVKVVPQTN